MKAETVLGYVGAEPVVRYIDGAAATPENLADLAWFDWTNATPLVLALDGDKVIGRWTSVEIRGAWIPALCGWLADHDLDHPHPLVKN